MKVEDLDTVFADVVPIPQDDGPNPVCVIAYKDDFKQSYDYMRAILKADERSGTSRPLNSAVVVMMKFVVQERAFLTLSIFTDRALDLTVLCLQLNPANYTVWHFRRQCLLDKLTEERLQLDLELAAELGGPNPKNYQIWYHRRALLEACGLQEERARVELDYVATVLEEDSKNYHVSKSRVW